MMWRSRFQVLLLALSQVLLLALSKLSKPFSSATFSTCWGIFPQSSSATFSTLYIYLPYVCLQKTTERGVLMGRKRGLTKSADTATNPMRAGQRRQYQMPYQAVKPVFMRLGGQKGAAGVHDEQQIRP
jgi:hypothetical protein